jgi:acetolactate synthase-1/2/3 large subunit
VFDPGLGAFSEVLAEADLIVLLGKKLDFTLQRGQAPFINSRAHFIQIDPDASVLALTERNLSDRTRLLWLAQSDVGHALDTLTRLLQNGSPVSSHWAEEVAQAVSFRPPQWNDLRSQEGQALHAAEVGQAINTFLQESQDSVFVSDGGEFGQWMQACVKSPLRVINGPSGAIGSAIPFALAARLAYPAAKIVACSGDGAFGFHPFEFDTAVRYKLAFIAVIGNDAAWNAEFQIQLRNYGESRAKGCELLSSAYHEAARALGAWGRQVKLAGELPAALLDADRSGLPACINVSIRREAAPKFERPL